MSVSKEPVQVVKGFSFPICVCVRERAYSECVVYMSVCRECELSMQTALFAGSASYEICFVCRECELRKLLCF